MPSGLVAVSSASRSVVLPILGVSVYILAFITANAGAGTPSANLY